MSTATIDPGITLIFLGAYVFHPTMTSNDMIQMISTLYERFGADRTKLRMSRPIITGSCLMISVIPIAASIPLITLVGTYFTILLALTSHNTTCNAPAMTSAKRKSVNPSEAMALTTIATRPAAGHETLSDELLIAPTTIPHTMPAIRPLIRGAQLAIEMPRHRGMATRNTLNHAGKSCFNVRNLNICDTI